MLALTTHARGGVERAVLGSVESSMRQKLDAGRSLSLFAIPFAHAACLWRAWRRRPGLS